jgi:hypothetical protein
MPIRRDRIANFAGTKSLSPFISSALSEMIMNPIRFTSRARGTSASSALLEEVA